MKYSKLLNLFLLLILAFYFNSCKKNNPIQYTFSGSVTESVNHSALEGVSVSISQRVYNSNVASSFFSTAGTATTSGGGSYEITFDREKVIEFKIKMVKSGYFSSESIISSSEVSTDETKVVNEVLEPQSWIKMHLYNVGGESTDIFTMIYYNFRENCNGCSTNEYHYFEGIVDSTFTITTTGGFYTKFSYKNPGAASYIQDSVYTTPFDTVEVNINY